MLQKISFFTLLLILSSTALGQENEKEWQLSLSGGAGSAGDPGEDASDSLNIDVKSLVHLTLHRKERQNDDGANLYYEFLYSQNTLEASDSTNEKADIDSQHLHIGGTYEWASSRWVRPYFSLGIGASHYEPDITDNDTYFSTSAALGSRVWINSSIAITLEARAIGTALSNDTGIFCPDEECTAGIDASLWWQRHYTAGVTWAF